MEVAELALCEIERVRLKKEVKNEHSKCFFPGSLGQVNACNDLSGGLSPRKSRTGFCAAEQRATVPRPTGAG